MNWQFWLRTRPLPLSEGEDNCAHVRPLLSLMSDGMASAKEVREAEAHLLTCADCRQAKLWMEATHQALIVRPIALPPADMRARIACAIAASAETAMPAVPVAMPPARRTFAVRPAYAAAASLTIAGAFLGHYLLTAGHEPGNAMPPSPTHIASSGHAQTGAMVMPKLSQPGHTPASMPRKQTAVAAALPHDLPSQSNPGQGSFAPPAQSGGQSRIPPASTGRRSGGNVIATLPTHGAQTNSGSRPAPQPMPASAPRRLGLIAARPAPQPFAGVTPHAGGSGPQLARVPTMASPVHAVPAPTLITPSPLPTPAPAAPTVVARLPDTTPAPIRAVPGDALGSIRVSLASYRNTSYARHLSMANGVHQRPNYVLAPIAYYAGEPEQTHSAHRAFVTASHPASVQAAPQAASPAPETSLTSSDQRRSERDKQWSDTAPTGGA